jgi:2-polyprenyl-3-methyl-5-hydroxy-6-metoxy-1,4-benzoquinol methylase
MESESHPLRRLNDAQVEAFDTEYVDDARWLSVRQRLDRDFAGEAFTFLDVGGGNGKFADRLLAEYPASKGTVLDNSEVLLARNRQSDRKTILLDSVENLHRLTGLYDVIFVNWLLHHVVADSYAKTRLHQTRTLKTLGGLLTKRGRISVFENIYDGFVIDNLPGWLIFRVTKVRV